MIVMPDAGGADALRYYVNQAQPQDLMLRLYVNDLYPARGDAAGRYVEASGAGYAAIRLAGSDWEILEPDGVAAGQAWPRATAREQAFLFSGPLGKVYGYYLTRAGNGRIAHAERFPDGPFEVARNGDRIRVIARLELRGEGR